MTYNLTPDQRFVLADCMRDALVGWLTTDPIAGHECRKLKHRAETICGFNFSRFVTASIKVFGCTYHPGCPGTANHFPLSIAECTALANDIELELATDDQLLAAGIIAAHNPLGQPEVGTRSWRIYIAMLAALGLSIDDEHPDWRHDVQVGLRPFRRAVATAHALAAE